MKRAYLEEDLELIRKYFPGANATTVRTPFDLTQRGQRLPRLATDSFRATGGNPHAREACQGQGWAGGAAWTN